MTDPAGTIHDEGVLEKSYDAQLMRRHMEYVRPLAQVQAVMGTSSRKFSSSPPSRTA